MGGRLLSLITRRFAARGPAAPGPPPEAGRSAATSKTSRSAARFDQAKPFAVLAASLALAACHQRRPPHARAVDASAPVAAAAQPAPPPQQPTPPDAAAEEPTPPIAPGDVLSGRAAEQAIANSVTPREPPPADAPALRIFPDGVGPLEIGMSRREVAARLGKLGRYMFRRVWRPPGEVGLERGRVLGANGQPLLRLTVYGGRLSEIVVVARDPRARTDADIEIGSTFEDAILAHGDARRTPRGFELSDLPGVLFVPETPLPRRATQPPPSARIGRIIVVGPAAD